MTSIGQMFSDQLGIIPQVTGTITHLVFWAATVFVEHYYDYCYTRLMS